MNYLSFFSLRQEPFSNAPVSRFYFNSEQHARALVRMMFAIENMKGLAVLAGNIGAGKSTTARRILESLPEDRYEVALMVMVQSGVSPHWFLTKIAYQLGVTQPAEDKTRLLGQLYRRLYSLHQAGRNAVVLVDEAQMLDTRELMEEIRGLLNMEIPEKKLLTLCLFGLPEMEEHLKLDPPLYQRIAVRGRLGSLSPEGTEAYIKHRLRLAGARRMLFTQEAVHAIHRATRGVPRLINTVCDNALFEGFLSRVNPITSKVVEGAVAELGYDGITEQGGAPVGAPSAASAPLTGGPSPGASMGWDAGRDFRPAAPQPAGPSVQRGPAPSAPASSRGAAAAPAAGPGRGVSSAGGEELLAGAAPGWPDQRRIDGWVREAQAWGDRAAVRGLEPEGQAAPPSPSPPPAPRTAPGSEERGSGGEWGAADEDATPPATEDREEAAPAEDDLPRAAAASHLPDDPSEAPDEGLMLDEEPGDEEPGLSVAGAEDGGDDPFAPDDRPTVEIISPRALRSDAPLTEPGPTPASSLDSLEASLASLPPAPERGEAGPLVVASARGPDEAAEADVARAPASVLGAAASMLRGWRRAPSEPEEPSWRRRIGDDGGAAEEPEPLDPTGTDGDSRGGWFRRRGRK